MSGESKKNRIRRQILNEWRGMDEPLDLNGSVHLPEEFTRRILKLAGLSDGVDEGAVKAAWSEVAGDFIARHAQPASIKNGHLVLHLAQPSMRFHLEQMKPMLLKRLQERLGASRVKSVQFSIG